jgi:WD40 repeat protein
MQYARIRLKLTGNHSFQLSKVFKDMRQRLRIFVSSPGDVKAAREIATFTIERLAQDYARFLAIEPYLWEFEAMVASGHFQDSIEPPSAFDVVILILWSRLGTMLPERTAVREYRGIDGRAPLTGTEWEFEEAMQAAKQSGAPDLLVYRNLKPAPFDTQDPGLFEQQSQQLKALNRFWERHFVNQGMFIGAYTSFSSDAEFAKVLENHLRKVIEKRIASLAVAPSATATMAWNQAPFRGLESYEYEHAPIFFGQDEALSKAMLKLTANAESGAPFLLVLGASGSGKSSLIKAGVVPKLFVPRRIPGIAFLRRVVFRPNDAQEGEDVFDAFVRRLTTRLSEEEGMPELIAHNQSPSSLAAHFRNAGSAPAYPIETALGLLTIDARRSGRLLEYENAKLVLVVDQLEELFNNEGISTGMRRRFIDLMRWLAHSGHVWILATMRKDFWHRADETPELVRLSEGNGRLELLPPSPAQMSQMIRRPAEAAGIKFQIHASSDVPLNEVIAEEVARESGALPLLSYLLDQLYRIDILGSLGNTFTYATYERLGKLEGAIATQAEAVLERCAPEDRAALASVLFALVEMGGAAGDVERAVARRIPLSTFQPGTSQRRLIDALLDPNARLVVSDSEKEGIPTVRIAHEALISHWARAREFVRGNADALKIRHRIEERYVLWRDLEPGSRAGQSPAPLTARFDREPGLLADIDLIDGQRLLKEHRADTEPHLIAFIERSGAENNRLRSRTVRMLSTVAIIVTILAVVASVAGWIASRKQHEAEYQADQTLQSQARLLTETAAQRLKDSDVPGARGIILEVLRNPEFANGHTPAAISVFQDIRAADPELAILSGHGDFVNSAVYSPDGARIVSASHDKSIRIWDARTGAQLAVLLGHSDRVIFAAYSPDGTRIVSTSRDKTARIWDARSGVQLVVLKGHDAVVTYAAYSPDSSRIVTSSADKTARIWDAHSGAPLATLNGHGDEVDGAVYSPDGTRIVTSSLDKTARIWDVRTGAQIAVLSGHEKSLNTAAYSPDGSRIATSANDGTVRIWDARTGAQLSTLSGPGGVFNSAAYSPDGSRIVTSSVDRFIRIWDVRSGAQVAALFGHGDVVNTAFYSPDGGHIVTASVDKTVRIWDGKDDVSLLTLSGHGNIVNTAVYSPDGARILTASTDKTARIWNARTGESLIILSGHMGGVQSAAYSPDGTRIVTTSKDKTARIWDAGSGAPLAILQGHVDGVNFAAYSPDGTRIVTSSFDKTARIWDALTGASLTTLSGHGGTVNTASYSPDGTRIVTSSFDKTARIWDARSGAQLAILSGHADSVESAAYSPDGMRVVTASQDMTARSWDALTGVPLLEFSGHRQALNSAAFSPDGTQLVTSGNDTARIWDARTGTQLGALPDHAGFADFSAVYSPDAARITTATYGKFARIWDARVPATIAAQILWEAATQADPIPAADRVQLGLPRESRAKAWPAKGSACDQATAAFYDPDRVTAGIIQIDIAIELANTACSAETKTPSHSPRADYELGRALLANNDSKGAKQEFELAASRGYRAAGIDLANIDPAHAIALNERAWKDGVAIAAYELGRRYETGLPTAAIGEAGAQPDPVKAWYWYEKGADAGEPTALGRLGERDDTNALAETDRAKRNFLLLEAFRHYAAAVERAKQEDWPDDAWKSWRYRRASLARILAREGMMQEVADAYRAVMAQTTSTLNAWQSLKARLHL